MRPTLSPSVAGMGAPFNALLAALQLSNEEWLRAHPRAPGIYRSGVRYRREDDAEEWLTIPEVLRRGVGDCEDLAAWRAAELRVRHGVNARAVAKRIRPGLIHIVVAMGDGTYEDPSHALGM